MAKLQLNPFTLRGCRTWHRWFAVSAVIILLISAITGVLLVYKKPLLRSTVASNAVWSDTYTPAAMPAQLQAISETFATHERVRIKAPNPEEPYWILWDHHDHQTLLAYDTLEPLTHYAWLLDILHVIHLLHVNLASGDIGEAILLIAGVMSLALGLSGLYIWWPSRRQWHARWVVPTTLKPKHFVQFHRHAGASVSVPLLLILLTGTLMMWQKQIVPLLPPLPPLPTPHPIKSDHSAGSLLQQAQQFFPEAWPVYIRLPDANTPQAKIRFRLPNEWHPNGRTSVILDTSSGLARSEIPSDQRPAAHRLLNQLYPLHSSYGLAWFYQLIVFISGLGLLWLCITGTKLYLERRKPARKKRINRQQPPLKVGDHP